MSNAFTRVLGTPTPQSESLDPTQVKNNAGGFVFKVEDQVRLERFLILGTDGGTYYSDEKKLTKDNIEFLREMIARDEQMVIDTVREISTTGRALRNSPAIFAVAAIFAWGKVKPATLVREVCRTSTHLFEFAEYVQLLGGWGRAKRSAVAEWYTSKSVDELAYQVVKYRQRNGWTHRDLLRLSHPVGLSKGIGNFILGKESKLSETRHTVPPIVYGFLAMQESSRVDYVLETLDNYAGLPWETIPTEFLKNVDVWKKLFYNGQLKGQVLLRNITRLARIGAFNDMVFARDYATRLTDEEMIKKTMLHPLNYLNALMVHTNGQVRRDERYIYGGSRAMDWTANPVIVDALNEGFHKAFKTIEPSGKRLFLGIDVSGSMSSSMCGGLDMTAAQCVAAMSMATAKVEPYYQIFGFSDGNRRSLSYNRYNDSVMTDLGISPGMDLSTVMNKTANQNFGRTDCALPMIHAKNSKAEVDVFVIYTDNETWCGNIHPRVALEQYRQAMGINAKLVVVAATPTEFSIADPRDRGTLDVSGADSNLPALISGFAAGRV